MLHLLHWSLWVLQYLQQNQMVYLPAGRPDMTLSLPMASAGIGAASMTGLTGLLLLLAGAGDALSLIHI